MPKRVVTSAKVPRPAAPYSPAILHGKTCYVAGLVSLDAAGAVVGRNDIKAQTRQVLENMASLLKEAGGDLSHVVKTTVYLTSFANYAGMNEVYKSHFPSDPPARATVRADLVNPDFLVEIDAIAVID